MEHQEHLVSVQFGRAGDSGYRLTWPFLIDGEQVEKQLVTFVNRQGPR